MTGLLIVKIIFAGATCLQLLFWIIFFRRLAFFSTGPLSTSSTEKESPPVSVIICARNEAENLQQYLPHFLNQKYRLFEVVVVNDYSTDETWSRLLDFQKKYSNLTPVNVPFATPPGKKVALTLGISRAKYDLLLLSDADCYPSSDSWIQRMQAAFRDNKQIVLGFSPYQQARGFLNAFIRFEAIYTAIQYFSFALAGMPYMGVGRNLMYPKALFRHRNGFREHLDLASGDDDLFINAAATRENTAIVLDRQAFVFSQPKTSWAGYYNQKTRHFSTGSHYRQKHKLLLGGLALSHFLHYAGIGILIIDPVERNFAIALYLVRMLVVAAWYQKILIKLHDQKLWPWLPLMDFMLPFYYLVFAPNIFSGKHKSWKQ